MKLKGITIVIISLIFISFVMPFKLSANTGYTIQSGACITIYDTQSSVVGSSIVDQNVTFNNVNVINSNYTHILGYNINSAFTGPWYNNNTCTGNQQSTTTSIEKILFNRTIYYGWGTQRYLSDTDDIRAHLDTYELPSGTSEPDVYDTVSIIIPNDNQSLFNDQYGTIWNKEVTYQSWSNTNPYYITPSEEVHVIGLGSGDVYFVSDLPFTIRFLRGSSDTTYTGTATPYIDGNTYYVFKYTKWSYSASYNYYFNWFGSSISNKYLAIYTMPHSSPSIQYGDVSNVGYYTRFVNNQQGNVQTALLNKDVISWDNMVDTLGNDITNIDFKVQIQAYGIEYSSLSLSDLLSMTKNDLQFVGNPVDIGIINARNGRFEITWGNVINALSQTTVEHEIASYLSPVLYEGAWIKEGWVYRIRLINDELNFEGNWNTIYQLTSFDVQPSQTIINYYINDNNSYPNEDVETLINNINQVNNTTNNWYVNETPIGYDPDGGNWLTSLIEKLVELIGTIATGISDIVKALIGLGSDLINGIFDLISNLGVNLLDTFTNLWNGFINLFNGINFTDENPEFDLDFDIDQESDVSPLQIVPAFVQMLNSAGFGYFLWLPLIVGIIFMVL